MFRRNGSLICQDYKLYKKFLTSNDNTITRGEECKLQLMESKTGSSGSTNRSNTSQSVSFLQCIQSHPDMTILSRSISLPIIFMRCIKSQLLFETKIYDKSRRKSEMIQIWRAKHTLLCVNSNLDPIEKRNKVRIISYIRRGKF